MLLNCAICIFSLTKLVFIVKWTDLVEFNMLDLYFNAAEQHGHYQEN